MTQTITERLETLLDQTGQPANPLRPVQVKEYQEEAGRLQKLVEAPPWVHGNRETARRRHGQLTEMLRKQAPKPIEDPAVKDEVAKLATTLLNETIRPAMQPVEVMRRAPAGAVDAFRSTEGSRAGKRSILAYKRAQWALHPDADDRDFTNLERYRPTLAGVAGPVATTMLDAQIPGVFGMTPQAKANWPLGEPTARTALAGAGYVPPEAAAQAAVAGDLVARVCAYRKCGQTFMARKDKAGLPQQFCAPPKRCAQRERTARSADKARARTAAKAAKAAQAAATPVTPTDAAAGEK